MRHLMLLLVCVAVALSTGGISFCQASTDRVISSGERGLEAEMGFFIDKIDQFFHEVYRDANILEKVLIFVAGWFGITFICALIANMIMPKRCGNCCTKLVEKAKLRIGQFGKEYYDYLRLCPKCDKKEYLS